jgi:hypothetical protein
VVINGQAPRRSTGISLPTWAEHMTKFRSSPGLTKQERLDKLAAKMREKYGKLK